MQVVRLKQIRRNSLPTGLVDIGFALVKQGSISVRRMEMQS